MGKPAASSDAPAAAGLETFHPCTRDWFVGAFEGPTVVQSRSWPSIAAGASALLLAPTGSGKTLAAFLAALDRLLFGATASGRGVRVLYVSPLKALAVDVDRNLRAPLAGLSAAAARAGVAHHEVTVALRTGDTASRERARMLKAPPDILITTPESLYLMLTSKAAAILENVETVIVDEIHTLVPSKRGAHLFLTLERLEHLRRQRESACAPLQRIGLSATQRPLDEVAQLLGGAACAVHGDVAPRPVTVVDASARRAIELSICMPLGDHADASSAEVVGNAATAPLPASIWPAVYPRLVELVRGHRSTMIFVNSRRLAERLASAINDTAEEDLAAAHHGSMARETRAEVEDRLKRGVLRALVATSSMELGVDMGAVDLVIQIEAPPSIASGVQRVGRAGHTVGAVSKGVVFPKYRGDLLACAAAAPHIMATQVEASAFPRNPLDVLAQHVVAMVAVEDWEVDALYALVRGAAPFAELPRSAFEEVLNLLSGRYPSDDFAGLRPRLTWDRLANRLTARSGAQRTAILNGGTIPDRGLYGVFLLGDGGARSRVGELDEEMVFELQTGEVFRLGASTWRTLEITNDQVLVEPAPGEPGKMPFWRGDGLGRPLELGRAVGALTRELSRSKPAAARGRLVREHALDDEAAAILHDYVADQLAATGEVPSDETIVVETFTDEVGDWRVVLLSPFGARVHAPWAMVAAQSLRTRFDDVDVVWTDDGIVFRLPESDGAPEADWFVPEAETLEEDLVRALGDTSLFAARFRENAARALLLPRRYPGRRTPLWLQRRKAADLLAAAGRFPQFPIVLETFRECLRDVFDLPGLAGLLDQIRNRSVRLHAVRVDVPSPFAQSVLFDFTASFIYEGDAPLAERRAHVLSLDHAQLKELLGSADYRELLDAEAVAAIALRRALLDTPTVKDADGVHDLLLALGDLEHDEIVQRVDPARRDALDTWLTALAAARRVLEVRIAGDARFIAAEDAARYRDALGTVLPAGLPAALLEPVAAPLADLVSRYARTHGPFDAVDLAGRFGLGIDVVRKALAALAASGRVLEGEFTPGSDAREWVDAEVLKQIKRRSLAGWRAQIEAVEQPAYAAFLTEWHNLDRPRHGLDALYDVIEQLQGAPLPASVLETEILPARVAGYQPGMLDELCGSGEVVWRGLEASGSQDGRIALYLADSYPLLCTPATPPGSELARRVLDAVRSEPAAFFDDIVDAVGGFPNDVLEALWDLVWSGNLTNDSLAPLRARVGLAPRRARPRRRGSRAPRGRRGERLPGSEGRWALLERARWQAPSATERRTAQAQQLAERYGVLVREALAREAIEGGFAAVYPVLKAMEDAGRLRRGYFVEGLGASQFALPGADDRLRAMLGAEPATRVLAATDPANAWGAVLPWPAAAGDGARLMRVPGARVVLHGGRLIGYLARTGQQLASFLPEAEPARGHAAAALADGLRLAARGRRQLLITRVDGAERAVPVLHEALLAAGFEHGYRGYALRGGDVVSIDA